ncbi:site-2 protease family protein [Pseudonocardia sp. CA-107938]|uniref:site-2 protease family protein n=1 Tax=Pseudonocardia sp. CA-107938 TaxID=3240021 RepID=UPI003D8E5184
MQTRLSPWFLVLTAATVVGGVLTVPGTADLAGKDHSFLLSAGLLLLVVGGWTMSLCLHEFGHAFVALQGGDGSVRDKGYLSLDVRKYADVGLSLVLPVLFLLLGGIALPGGAVWIDHGAIRSRAMRSLVSLAGPVINLVLGILLLLVAVNVAMPLGLTAGLSTLAFFQLLAFLLNILPVPGLDGWGVIEPYVAPRGINPQVRSWGPLVFFVLLLAVPPLLNALWAGAAWIYDLFGGDLRLYRAGYNEMRFWDWARW